jgi:hypothetical protein
MKKLMIMVASFALVATFALTAAADDQWNFYGSARVSTFVTDADVPGGTNDFAMGLQGNARIGANVKVSDELSGRFEYGSGPNLRLLYGTWNFGGGALTVGQVYTPLNMFMSNQVFGADTGLLDTGGVYSGRAPVLQVSFGSVKIAAVVPVATNNTTPTIEASYSLKHGPASIAVAGGYDSEVNAAGNEAYVLAASAAINFGAAYIKGDVYTGDNAEALIWTAGTGENNTGYLVVAGFKVNDMLSLEAGYGNAEGDTAEEYAYYVQAPITLASGVYVIPEVGAQNDGDTTYFGAKWQINF